MTATKLFLRSANPGETKRVAALIGGLDGQLVTIVDLVAGVATETASVPHTVEGIRAYTKHLGEALEPFLPGGRIFIEDLFDPTATPDMLMESSRRTMLWGRQTSLVLPVTLEGIEVGNMLSRQGTPLVFSPVTSLDQLAAILAATEEAQAEQVVVIIPVDALVAGGVSAASVITEMQALCQAQAGARCRLMLSVSSVASFVWGLAHGVPYLAVTPAVMTDWIEAGKPTELDATMEHSMSTGSTQSPYTVDFTQEKNSFAVSNALTDVALMANHEAWKSLL